MSIGATLVAARQAAGLTVAEVSERTRIRPALIRSIERDDFSACGGDFYARGHIRAIARTAGTDSVPLIEEYDAIHPAGHSPSRPTSMDDLLDGPVRMIEASGADAPGSGVAAGSGASSAASAGGEAHAGTSAHEDAAAEADAGPEAGAAASPEADVANDADEAGGTDETAVAGESTADDSVPAGTGPGAIEDVGTGSHEWFPGWYARQPENSPDDTADDLAGTRAAGYSDPGYAVEPAAAAAGVSGGAGAARATGLTGPGTRRPRGTWQLASLALVALAIIGVGGYWVSAFPGTQSAAASPPTRVPTGSKGGRPSANGRGVTPSASASPSAPGSPSPSRPVTQVTDVSPVSAEAYGPDGTSDGDNPQSASGALSGSAASAWQSQWYTTAEFGNLKSGTGLLVSLSRTVTATGVIIGLGDTSGATIKVRAGTSLGSLRTVGTASGTGGSVHLSFASDPSVQYLLIWFTQLPADADGSYQAAVSGVTVTALKK